MAGDPCRARTCDNLLRRNVRKRPVSVYLHKVVGILQIRPGIFPGLDDASARSFVVFIVDLRWRKLPHEFFDFPQIKLFDLGKVSVGHQICVNLL
jgi:hypothetical protein